MRGIVEDALYERGVLTTDEIYRWCKMQDTPNYDNSPAELAREG